MLESKVNQEHDDRQDDRSDQDQQRRTLQLLPSRPRHLFGEFRIGLFKIVNELTHLCFGWAPENWKRESGNLC